MPGENLHLGPEKRTNKLNPACEAKLGNQPQATLVGGKFSHHCTIPALSDIFTNSAKQQGKIYIYIYIYSNLSEQIATANY